MKSLPQLRFWQIWNLSFGFFGVQIGYSLQNGNTSRILSSLGANVEHLSYFWLAAPITGLLIQPIVGLMSDRTWSRLGRRIPYIIAGAVLSAMAMFLMPNAEHFVYLLPPLVFGALVFIAMDISFNITMQPFRALVGDMVNDQQRNQGYSVQSFLINAGAVLGSILPFLLVIFGIGNTPDPGEKVSPSVIWSFYIGGSVLLISVLITSFFTKEYQPSDYKKYHGIDSTTKQKLSFYQTLKSMPKTMYQLGMVQFFSWFALFLMWVYSTPGIAQNVWHTDAGDSTSASYNEAANWVGVIFAFYSLFGALFSLLMARLANRLGRKTVYSIALLLGGIGLTSIYLVQNQYLLILTMLGVGIAWAAILAMPYAILSATLPANQMGIYMGIFNATITIPQIFAGLSGGIILALLGSKAILMLVVAGISMLVAALGVFLVKEKKSNE